MIDKLTPEQEARFPEFVERWTNVGLSTAPLDQDQAREAVNLCYQCGGVPAPRKILFYQSPWQMYAALTILKQIEDEGNLDSQICEATDEEAAARVLSAIEAGEHREGYSKVVGQAVGESCYGAHDAGWLSFYSYMREVVGLEQETEQLRGLFLLAETCGWIYPGEKVCLVSERPVEIHRDENGRLHATDRAALSFSDGTGLYMVHGVRVPKDIILDHSSITPGRIQGEQNAEIKRVMLELMGEENYIQAIGAEPVHEDEFGRLYRAEIPGDEPLVMVRLVNSTPEPDGSFKTYWLRVPPTMERARQAVAWTFGMTEDEYAPVFES